jgi:hypothetical protein
MSVYSPTYYPGVVDVRSAAIIKLGVSEERDAVDVRVVLQRPQTISGTVIFPPGTNTIASVSLVSDVPEAAANRVGAAIVQRDGSFRFVNLVSGTYDLIAEAMVVPSAEVQLGPRFWAQAQVTTDSQSVSNITLTLQDGRSVSGHVVLEQPRGAASLPSTVTLRRVGRYTSHLPPIPGIVGPDGSFSLQGASPGRYTFEVSSGTAASAVVAGIDTLDFPLMLNGTEDVSDVLITMSDSVSELSGTLTDSRGSAETDPTIVIAAADPRFWTPGSRRILITRPGADGRYVFRGLPPGEYLLAAVDDLPADEQFNIDFLRQLSAGAVKVVLGKGARLSQNLRLTQARP